MLKDKLQTDLPAALKEGDQIRVSTLRTLLASLHNLEIQRCPPGSGKILNDQEVISVIQKQVRERQESIEMFKKGKRQDLVEKEETELGILKSYLPKELENK